MKKILLVLPILLLGLAACGGEAEPEAPAEPEVTITSAEPEVTITSAEPEVTITSAELLSTYEANEVNADNLYKGKLATITGPVGDIGTVLGSTYITLTDGNPYSILSVQCTFKDEAEIEKLGALTKGQEVTVVGTISGQSLNITVDDCKLV